MQDRGNVFDDFDRVTMVLSKDLQAGAQRSSQFGHGFVKVPSIAESTAHHIMTPGRLQVRSTQNRFSNGNRLSVFENRAIIISLSLIVHTPTVVGSPKIELAILDFLLVVFGFALGEFVNFSCRIEMLHGGTEILIGTIGKAKAQMSWCKRNVFGSQAGLLQSHCVKEFRDGIIVKSLDAQGIANVVVFGTGIVAYHDFLHHKLILSSSVGKHNENVLLSSKQE
mmetsp:Transcript_18521/g.38174  ORF Transcript_18521/g.38174 Transcript_18521/m.38174 type:complete len:224 (-) Transcript_18521:20-691(-)